MPYFSSSRHTFFDYKKRINNRFELSQTTSDEPATSIERDYAYTSKIREHVALDFSLYSSLLDDPLLIKQPESVQKKIGFIYLQEVDLLLEHARCYDDPAHFKLYAEDKEQKQPQSPKQAPMTNFSTVHLVEWINFINAYRRITLLSRSFWKKFLLVAQDLNWLYKNNNLFFLNVDIDILDIPTDLYNILGVAIYLTRLAINMILFLKHVFFPTNSEKSINATDRFFIELQKRYKDMGNELIKSIVNTLTNYASYFQLTPIAPYLILSLLLFDFVRLLYLSYIEEEKIHTHRQIIQSQFDEPLAHDDQIITDLILFKLSCLQAETTGKLYFSIAAALTLITSFAASLMFPLSTALPLFMLITVLASVMYLSAGKFGQFMRARSEYQFDIQNTNKLANLNQKRDYFLSSMGKNLFIPLFLIGLSTIYWPVALSLTCLYLMYEQSVTTPIRLIQTPIIALDFVDEFVPEQGLSNLICSFGLCQ